MRRPFQVSYINPETVLRVRQYDFQRIQIRSGSLRDLVLYRTAVINFTLIDKSSLIFLPCEKYCMVVIIVSDIFHGQI